LNVFETSGLTVEPLDPANFVGSGTLVRMLDVCRSPKVNAYRVTFEPGARTAWHTHSGPQLLIVVEGRCRFQRAGMPVSEVADGGIISIDPGEPHWHGAPADSRVVHVAVNIDVSTEWLAQVTDAEYAGEI